jgi:hypothetical protein
MDNKVSLLVGLSLLLAGVLVGACGLAQLWTWHTSKPEVAREMLKAVYRKAHPHWLQRSEQDSTLVCPCCGWSETEGAGKPIESPPNETPGP